MKQLLIINDLCGFSSVATTAMMPILSYMGIPTKNLPTAIVSNNLEYGRFALLETTEYIQETFKVWKELGFHNDAIATGFMASEREAEIIAEYCKEQAVTGTTVFVDPIMGDEGKLYNGITETTVNAMRRMLSVATLCFPNYTEACYLTNTDYKPEGISREEAYDLVAKLRAIGSRSVIITSIPVDGKPSVVGYNTDIEKIGREKGKEHFVLSYDEIPVRIPGTGDLFSAIVISHLLKGKELKESTRRAMDNVRTLIDLNKNNEDKYRGIPIERYLHVLD